MQLGCRWNPAGHEQDDGRGRLSPPLPDDVDRRLDEPPFRGGHRDVQQLGADPVDGRADAAVQHLEDEEERHASDQREPGSTGEHQGGEQCQAAGDARSSEQDAHQEELRDERQEALTQLDVRDQLRDASRRAAGHDRRLEQVVEQRAARGGQQREPCQQPEIGILPEGRGDRPVDDGRGLGRGARADLRYGHDGEEHRREREAGGRGEQQGGRGGLEEEPSACASGHRAEQSAGRDEPEGPLGVTERKGLVRGEPELDEDQ